MKENKKKIVESFTPVIRQTRAGSDVARLEYCLKNGDEVVDVTFVNGMHTWCNVTGDSGAAMLRDIIKRLM